MKKFLIICALIALPKLAMAQGAIVHDPLSYISIAKQTANSAKEVAALVETKNTLKKSLDFVAKVNNTMINAAYAKDVLKMQIQLVGRCGKMLTRKDAKSLSSYRTMVSNVQSIISRNKALTDLLSKSLSPDFKMNDGERLNTLITIEDKTRALNKSLSNIESTYNISLSLYKLIKK